MSFKVVLHHHQSTASLQKIYTS